MIPTPELDQKPEADARELCDDWLKKWHTGNRGAEMDQLAHFAINASISALYEPQDWKAKYEAVMEERHGWHGVVKDCERVVEAVGTAESPLMSNIANLVRDIKTERDRLRAELDAMLQGKIEPVIGWHILRDGDIVERDDEYFDAVSMRWWAVPPSLMSAPWKEGRVPYRRRVSTLQDKSEEAAANCWRLLEDGETCGWDDQKYVDGTWKSCSSIGCDGWAIDDSTKPVRRRVHLPAIAKLQAERGGLVIRLQFAHDAMWRIAEGRSSTEDESLDYHAVRAVLSLRAALAKLQAENESMVTVIAELRDHDAINLRIKNSLNEQLAEAKAANTRLERECAELARNESVIADQRDDAQKQLAKLKRWQDEVMEVANKEFNLDGCCHWEAICDGIEEAVKERDRWQKAFGEADKPMSPLAATALDEMRNPSPLDAGEIEPAPKPDPVETALNGLYEARQQCEEGSDAENIACHAIKCFEAITAKVRTQ